MPVLAQGVRGFCPWSLGLIALGLGNAEHHSWEDTVEQSSWPHGGQEAKRETKWLGPHVTHFLPWPCLPKAPPPPHCTTGWDQVLWGTFQIQTTAGCISQLTIRKAVKRCIVTFASLDIIGYIRKWVNKITLKTADGIINWLSFYGNQSKIDTMYGICIPLTCNSMPWSLFLDAVMSVWRKISISVSWNKRKQLCRLQWGTV
jgi:hypothetical protein